MTTAQPAEIWFIRHFRTPWNAEGRLQGRRDIALDDPLSDADQAVLAANRAALEGVAQRAGVPFLAPPLALCTDNAAMIAWAGMERFRAGAHDDLTLSARPRWPLDRDAPALIGSGKRGAKA